jgi:hypothetical protein
VCRESWAIVDNKEVGEQDGRIFSEPCSTRGKSRSLRDNDPQWRATRGSCVHRHEPRPGYLGTCRHRAGFDDTPRRATSCGLQQCTLSCCLFCSWDVEVVCSCYICWILLGMVCYFWGGVRCGLSAPCLRIFWSVGWGLHSECKCETV